MSNMETLVNRIAVEQNFTVHVETEFKISDDLYLNLYIATKDSFEYFIFIDLPYTQLQFVNKKIQITLFTQLKKKMLEQEALPFEVTHFFEKNTSLILTTNVPDEESKLTLLKSVSAIEEDSYYYKKQVLYYSNLDLDIIINKRLLDINSSEYCNTIISNIEKYELFVSFGDEEYDFIARLYEKLPFLTLSVTEREQLDLDSMINVSLSIDELEELPNLLALTTSEAIDNWIENIGILND
jgi:hypothetical protein